jgi:hypothetical protein
VLLRNYKYSLIPIFIILSLFALKGRAIFSYSLDNDGLEFYFINTIQRMQLGVNIYADPLSLPYGNCLYTPIYFYFLNSVYQILHIDVFNDLHLAFIIGRMFSFVCVLIQVIYLYKFIRKIHLNNTVVIISISCYLMLITGHMYALRPDALKDLFFILFLFYAFEYVHFSKRYFYLVLAAIFGILSLFTKQDIIFHLSIFSFVTLLIYRNKRILLLLSVLAMGIICVFSFIFWYHGKYIIDNWFLLNAQTIDDIFLVVLMYIIIPTLVKTAPFIILTLCNLLGIRQHRLTDKFQQTIVIMGVMMYVVSHLVLMRAGANLNYTYEMSFVLILNVNIFYVNQRDFIQRFETRFLLSILFFLIFLFGINILFKYYKYEWWKEKSYKTVLYQNLKERSDIKKYLNGQYVYFPNTELTAFYPEHTTILGHDMHLDRFIQIYTGMNYKSRLSYINTATYDSNFRNGIIQFIVISNAAPFKKHVEHYYPSYSLDTIIQTKAIYRYTQK